jgi:hypothetical protein
LKKGSVIIEQDHYRGNNSRTGNFERLKQLFLESFPGEEMFIEKLKAQKRINANYQLYQIIELSKLYKKEDFLDAIAKALLYNVFHASFIAGYLEKNFKQTFQISTLEITERYEGYNIKRKLTDYQLH